MSKLEFKRKSFSKVAGRVQAEIDSIYKQCDSPSTRTVIKIPQSPSNEPLPMFWCQPKRPHFQLYRGSSEPEISVEAPMDIKE